MRNLRKYLESEKFRFLIVGGVNTLLGYGLFSAFEYFWGHTIGLLGSLYLAHICVSTLAFWLYRRHVYKVRGHVIKDFVRFQGVYAFSFAANTVALPLLVSVFHWNVYLSQALIIVMVTVTSYIGHKYFSFRRGTK